MKKTTVMKIGSALLCAASVLFFGIYGAYRWALWRVEHPAPGTASSIAVVGEAGSIGVIGGADGPTAILVTVGGPMEVYLAAGLAFLAGAVGLFLWARKISKGR